PGTRENPPTRSTEPSRSRRPVRVHWPPLQWTLPPSGARIEPPPHTPSPVRRASRSRPLRLVRLESTSMLLNFRSDIKAVRRRVYRHIRSEDENVNELVLGRRRGCRHECRQGDKHHRRSTQPRQHSSSGGFPSHDEIRLTCGLSRAAE